VNAGVLAVSAVSRVRRFGLYRERAIVMNIMMIGLAVAGTLQVGSLPVVAGHLVTGASSRVQISNTGGQPVTAWSLAITTHPEEGRTHRVVLTSDAYLADVTRDLPRASPHLDWLRPGQTFDVPLDPQPADATVQVMAVVLEDGTALGEPGILASIFEHRAAERDELRKVVDTFTAVLSSKHGAAAIEELKARFNASPDPGLEGTPHRSAREAVETFAQRAAAGKADEADQSIRSYAAFVQRQYEVAAKHAVRR
jgi:hypothetical protein